MHEGPETSAALQRIARPLGGQAFVDALADRVPGSDLTTLLLEVFRRRAHRLSPADVLRRYRSDRFVAPGQVLFADLRRAEDALLAALPDAFDVLTLAPVVPLGTHSAYAAVDPRNVIATIRGSEVAADPTNGLALETAVRRQAVLEREPRSAEPVRLAATQRVTRAQLVSGPVSFAHFQLFGVVTAGRDTGDRAFERQHLAEHLLIAQRALTVAGADRVTIAVTCRDEPSAAVLEAVRPLFAEITDAPERTSGLAYYRGLCFKIYAAFGGSEPLEIADGGFVDWTARLLGSQKERLLISGYGVDRLALLSGASV
jgi:hypothetical protein